jgi:AI-2 transport protein TqsA
LLSSVDLAALRIREKLPTYAERLTSLYAQVLAFMSSRGVAVPTLSLKEVITPDRLREVGRVILPVAGAIISNGLLIFLLAFLFVTETLEDIGGKKSPLGSRLDYYASDSRRYVAVTAKSAGINALVNLGFLILMGVDTPVVWSFLYFFLDFIPTLGYIVALVPPTFVTLLMYGWKRAVLVAVGLVLTNLIVDNLVTPSFMKNAVDISFLEITLSLLGWTLVLGLTGAILAVPLTLALKRFINGQAPSADLATVPSG